MSYHVSVRQYSSDTTATIHNSIPTTCTTTYYLIIFLITSCFLLRSIKNISTINPDFYGPHIFHRQASEYNIFWLMTCCDYPP